MPFIALKSIREKGSKGIIRNPFFNRINKPILSDKPKIGLKTKANPWASYRLSASDITEKQSCNRFAD